MVNHFAITYPELDQTKGRITQPLRSRKTSIDMGETSQGSKHHRKMMLRVSWEVEQLKETRKN